MRARAQTYLNDKGFDKIPWRFGLYWGHTFKVHIRQCESEGTLILNLKHYKDTKLGSQNEEPDIWKLLSLFDSKTRVQIIKMLLKVEWQSLSEIQRKLQNQDRKEMTLPGVLKHMKELEEAGIVRKESGAFIEKPDARKTIYMLEGKERIQKIMNQLENNVGNMLKAGAIFNQTANLARKIQGRGRKPSTQEKEQLKSLLDLCEKIEISQHLTEDEKKKIKLWKMMLELEK
jgi:DNA-binding transcriptional ArsR family regulator